MTNRYNKSRVFRDDNGKQYLNRIEYPVIPLRDSDIFINGKFGQTFINLANQFYGDKDLWWIIEEQIINQNLFIPFQVKNIVFHKKRV